MAWIESHQQLKDHPKVFELMSMMEWDLDQTIGKLHRFWWWCVDYAEDGNLTKFSDSQIGHAVGLNGDQAKCFVKAMLETCWLDREPYFRVHDWWRYIGRFLNGKYSRHPKSAERVRKLYKCRTATVRKPCLPNLTKPNKTTPPYSPPKGCVQSQEILEYLNLKSGKKFSLRGRTLGFISSRLADFSAADLKRVIDLKVQHWRGTEMDKYLRPETLFNATKFESYVNEKETKEDQLAKLTRQLNQTPQS